MRATGIESLAAGRDATRCVAAERSDFVFFRFFWLISKRNFAARPINFFFFWVLKNADSWGFF
jgi:hypothetical protein